MIVGLGVIWKMKSLFKKKEVYYGYSINLESIAVKFGGCGPTCAAFQGNRAEEDILLYGDALLLPHFEHCEKCDDDDQAGTFMFDQFTKRDTGAHAQQCDDFEDTVADCDTRQG